MEGLAIRKTAGRKTLIPGVVSHATNVVEHPELIADRLIRLADLVGRENVMAGTDCGFAQGPFTRRVHPTIQWAKLRAQAEGAKLATQKLWAKPRWLSDKHRLSTEQMIEADHGKSNAT